jgi:hypothetical protein
LAPSPTMHTTSNAPANSMETTVKIPLWSSASTTVGLLNGDTMATLNVSLSWNGLPDSDS